MNFQLKDKETGELISVYGVERKGGKTLFLCHTKEYEWSWVDSSYLEPLKVKELDMLRDNSDEDRLDVIKEIMKRDYSNRHDSAMLNLYPNDLNWLVKQAEKVKHYEKALKRISKMKDVGLNQEYLLKRYSKYAKDVLNGKFE